MPVSVQYEYFLKFYATHFLSVYLSVSVSGSVNTPQYLYLLRPTEVSSQSRFCKVCVVNLPHLWLIHTAQDQERDWDQE